MYETMAVWETMALDDQSPAVRDFAEIWRAADKVVYSRTLAEASTARTRLEREFDASAVREMKERATADIGVGGPELAAQAIRAGLVDEIQLFLVPVLVGGSKRSLPTKGRVDLDLHEQRRFRNGTVFLRYAVPNAG
jgi:riboflavin biosynthesis pyrimidine reductase